jgi:hypothetical protein
MEDKIPLRGQRYAGKSTMALPKMMGLYRGLRQGDQAWA